ncbi:Alpha/beta hydrolase fold-1 [Talaromyces proteolyticus]|uniref:Alpha/beta hydrolase fold-1 n=1 Tax=Talaromyces proteolyticus TaxID=1131652 RepID=A0AAD4KY04_9EURO|nr:Alpha/beta hydrolase fold-1 [Talaromyces proteolyticus]KAH8702376.1 Alpha/beta hydrolase fold-1 [Talaromyces proteolyticus]
MSPFKELAVVICHGSYYTPAPYVPFMEALKSQGLEAYCPQRPTCDLSRLNVGDINNPDFDRDPPTGGYPTDTEDVDAVVEILKKLANDEGKLVLLVAHSSGGWVATQAAVPELHAKARQAEGKAGGIIGIFYMGAFVVPVGESVNSFFQPKDGTLFTPPFMRFHKLGHAGLGTIVDAPHFMFNDIDPVAAEKWAATLTAAPNMPTKLTNNPYSSLPCSYLVLENDQTLPKEYQEQMIALQSQGTSLFTVYRAPSGHSPHLSWTTELVEKVAEFIDKILNE